jgi:hypothetical protein
VVPNLGLDWITGYYGITGYYEMGDLESDGAEELRRTASADLIELRVAQRDGTGRYRGSGVAGRGRGNAGNELADHGSLLEDNPAAYSDMRAILRNILIVKSRFRL